MVSPNAVKKSHRVGRKPRHTPDSSKNIQNRKHRSEHSGGHHTDDDESTITPSATLPTPLLPPPRPDPPQPH